MVTLLYRIARAAAWGRAVGKLMSGNPAPIAKRVRNKIYFRMFGRFLK
jgi:hypothetical protein